MTRGVYQFTCKGANSLVLSIQTNGVHRHYRRLKTNKQQYIVLGNLDKSLTVNKKKKKKKKKERAKK